MSEKDFNKLDADLNDALSSFDQATASDICGAMVRLICTAAEPVQLNQAKSILSRLRRKRLFPLVTAVADAVLTSGQTHPQIKRQYAQGLIDQGFLSAGEALIGEMLDNPEITKGETLEAVGLKGRVCKQRFVGVSHGENKYKTEYLRLAIDAYLSGSKLDEDSYWHAINVVALLKRAERDQIAFEGMPPAADLAAGVERFLREKAEESTEPSRPWEVATLMEANIAMDRFDEALTAAMAYASLPDADAFEIGSTIRQLVEIWQLDDTEPPGSDILPVLRSALLEREGGAIRITPGHAVAEKLSLESKFGDDAPKTLRWYTMGLERTASVVRIELPDGRGIGTAGVYNGAEFFADFEGVILLTNSHVISNNPDDRGLAPGEVRANIQSIGETFEVGEIVWSSPERELDATFVTIKGTPEVTPLPVARYPTRMANPAPRVYVIGHPNGRDLEISLNDNRMVGSNETRIHYRTPTEPGSSGSPVFDQFGWEVIGLHHAGGESLPRIDGEPGTYQANEGIAITAIKSAILQAYTQSA